MTNLPFGMAQALVEDHQRELQELASRWRLRRRRPTAPERAARAPMATVTILPTSGNDRTSAAA